MSDNEIAYAALSVPDREQPEEQMLVVQRVIKHGGVTWHECVMAVRDRWPDAKFQGWYANHVAYSNGSNDVHAGRREESRAKNT